MKIELESIENLLAEYDVDTQKNLHNPNELFGIIDSAVENKIKKPDDISIEDIDDLDF